MTTLQIEQFVRGDTQRGLTVQLRDALAAPIDITGWTLTYKAASPDLPDVPLEASAIVIDGLTGICRVPEFGNLVSATQLGRHPIARYFGRVTGVNLSGKQSWSDLFEADILAQPLPEI